jgi:outer membrane protein assembly factor BamE (lipoprotein component of BamABCDE complex)
MIKILLIIAFYFNISCTLNKVINHHGVHFLEEKNKKLTANNTNLNDINQILGPPLIKSTFDNNVLIFIEKKTSSSKLSKLGKKKLLINNVLILEINNRGMLVDKKFFNKDDLQKIDFSKSTTVVQYNAKRDFIYNFLSGLRQKINDPLGKKRIKND